MIQKFRHAIDGLQNLLLQDRNIQIQCLMGTLTVISGFIFQISATEWFVVLGFIALVLSLEVVNSCLEKICDFIHPGYHIEIKYIKDGSAAAVLIASITALIAATIIFLPKIICCVHSIISSI